MAHLFVGTSGWTYTRWKGIFYPEDLPSRHYLEFYSRKFDSTEVNYSFYHLPRPSTYDKWVGQVPEEFLFAVKASRFITHVKRLAGVDDAWRTFVENARTLRGHLGPILLQLPPSFRCDRTKLAAFLKITHASSQNLRALRLTVEFRHESWFTEEIYAVLRCHNVACCIADSPGYPRRDVATANFVCQRFHGRTHLFASKYTKGELTEEAKRIREHLREGRDVFAYFNNDAKGHAVENARTLRQLVLRKDSL